MVHTGANSLWWEPPGSYPAFLGLISARPCCEQRYPIIVANWPAILQSLGEWDLAGFPGDGKGRFSPFSRLSRFGASVNVTDAALVGRPLVREMGGYPTRLMLATRFLRKVCRIRQNVAPDSAASGPIVCSESAIPRTITDYCVFFGRPRGFRCPLEAFLFPSRIGGTFFTPVFRKSYTEYQKNE